MNSSDTLNVWYENTFVGKIWRNASQQMGFEYSDEWLNQGFPISCQIPLSKKIYEPNEGVAHKFFANLLPEEGARRRLVLDLKLTDTDFSLLAALGRECAGALTILPANEHLEENLAYQPLSEEDLKKIVLRKGMHISDISHDSLPRLSLAGAQDKIPIYYSEDQFFLPKGTAPSSHLIKFELADYKHIPAYECFLSELAKSINIPVAHCELKKCEKLNFLLITRYDRIKVGDQLKRLHQEDFCQALGISYANKYESDGGPTFYACFELLQNVSSFPLKDIQNLLKWQIFNFLAGNSDGHAKNLSIVYEKNQIHLAPIYDLVCTRAIRNIDPKLALSVGGERDPGKITLDHWISLAKLCDLRQRYMLSVIEEVATGLKDNFKSVQDEFESKYGAYEALQRVKSVVEKQCGKMLKELSKKT